MAPLYGKVSEMFLLLNIGKADTSSFILVSLMYYMIINDKRISLILFLFFILFYFVRFHIFYFIPFLFYYFIL